MKNHKNCYAALLGGCEGALEKEHFVSESVLKIVGNKTVKVTGYPWQSAPIQEVGVKSLVSKVLCTKHNRTLSEVDAAGKSFVSKLLYSANHLVSPHERYKAIEEPTSPQNGLLLERWFLKCIYGSWAADAFPNSRLSSNTNGNIVAAIFGHILQEPCGLYIGSNKKEFTFEYPLTIETTSFFNGGDLLGAHFQINGIELILNLTDDPENLKEVLPDGATYRPQSLVIVGRTASDESGIHHIMFDWENQPVGKHTLIIRQRTR